MFTSIVRNVQAYCSRVSRTAILDDRELTGQLLHPDLAGKVPVIAMSALVPIQVSFPTQSSVGGRLVVLLARALVPELMLHDQQAGLVTSCIVL